MKKKINILRIKYFGKSYMLCVYYIIMLDDTYTHGQ